MDNFRKEINDLEEALEEEKEKVIRLKDGVAIERIISQCLCDILLIKLMDLDIKEFLKEQNIHSVVVYGMGKIGTVLAKYLVSEGVNIVYAVDRDRNIQFQDVEIRHELSEMTDDADIIIVTSEFLFEEIKEDIMNVINTDVIMVRDFLENILLNPQKI